MKRLFLAVSLFAFGCAFAAEPASSIFVQTPEVFHRRMEDLQKLQKDTTNRNKGLDSLLMDADRIAKMNDQCAAVSINDVMGDECWNFYQVVLPEFEDRYMRVTGELRLGYMEMVRGLEDRKMQIDACVDALYSFAESKDQFLNLDGGVYLEPLSKGFQANYNFTLKYDPGHQKQIFEIAKKWADACHEIVVTQDGENFAPFFVERLAKLNDNLKENGSLAVYKMDTAEHPVLYLDNSRPIRSAYYLNGRKLFHCRISAGSLDESNIRIHFEKGNTFVDGASIVRKHGRDVKFKGSWTFAARARKMTGRWVWENQGNTAGIDFGPDADELDQDSLLAAYKHRKKREFYFRGSLTGVDAVFYDEKALDYGMNKKDVMILPDLSASAGLKTLGNLYCAMGAGAMIGLALSKDLELERAYAEPLVQFELGYKRFGIRETVIIPVPESDIDEWLTFRSGLVYKASSFGVELGHARITNLGQGAYASVFFEL